MEFIQHITTYYQTEARHGLLTASTSGIVLTLAAIPKRIIAAPSSIPKGMAVPFLIGGLIFLLGGSIAGYNARKAIAEKTELYESEPKVFIISEYEKVEKIHQSWPTIRVFWSLFIVSGLVLLFSTTNSFWVGMALGFLIIGTTGHIEEAVSYLHNEKYRKEVQWEKHNSDAQFPFTNFKINMSF